MAPEPQHILGPSGPIAGTLGDRFEPRPEQTEMAAAVTDALAARAHLLVEAGTGVGKSFAYLVPAILRCVFHQERVVVSTHTIALQEQLIQKDIPLLQAALEDAGVIPRPGGEQAGPAGAPPGVRPLRPVLVKGRNNYISLRRLQLAVARQESLLDPAGRAQLRQIERWARQTPDGTRATLPVLDQDGAAGSWGTRGPLPEVWSQIESDSDNCMGAKCPRNAECFYQNARREMGRANLLICNHALFFSDLALRARPGGAGFLPQYDHVVLDEAHAAEDVAAEHLGMSLTEGRVQFFLRGLFDARRAKGYLAQLVQNPLSGADRASLERAATLVQDAWAAAAQFFDDWRRLLDTGQLGNGRVRRPGLVQNALTPALRDLGLRLDALRESVRQDADKFELNAYARRAGELALGADAFVNQSLPGCVYWVESGGAVTVDARGRPRRVTLACAPVDAAPLLQEMLFKQPCGVIMTSATLATAGRSTGRPARGSGAPRPDIVPLDEDGREQKPGSGAPGGTDPFSLVASRLGCRGARTLLLGSPFDYARQMSVFIEQDAPDPADRTSSATGAAARGDAADPNRRGAYPERLAGLILKHVDATDGGAFVLFNAFSVLRSVAALLREPLAQRSMPLLVHEPDASRSELLARFKADPRSVLLGAASFWQGVDVPGHALRNVIIGQLPFEPPDRPLTEARSELVATRGGDPFRDDSLPRAVIRFKQGIGRLVRSRTDTGRVVVLDPRIVSRGYGRAFLNSLPAGVQIRRM